MQHGRALTAVSCGAGACGAFDAADFIHKGSHFVTVTDAEHYCRPSSRSAFLDEEARRGPQRRVTSDVSPRRREGRKASERHSTRTSST